MDTVSLSLVEITVESGKLHPGPLTEEGEYQSWLKMCVQCCALHPTPRRLGVPEPCSPAFNFRTHSLPHSHAYTLTQCTHTCTHSHTTHTITQHTGWHPPQHTHNTYTHIHTCMDACARPRTHTCFPSKAPPRILQILSRLITEEGASLLTLTEG